MVEHEGAHTTQDTTPETDRFPAQHPERIPEQEGPDRNKPVEQAYRRARHASGWWARMAIAAVVLIVLLVFIIENLQTVNIAFFGMHWQLPAGVAMLLAAVCGVLLVLVPSFGRIIQLRRTLRRAAHSK